MGLGFDPDRRLQEVIRLVFQKFRELGSARQVLLWMASRNIHFPYPSNGSTLTLFGKHWDGASRSPGTAPEPRRAGAMLPRRSHAWARGTMGSSCLPARSSHRRVPVGGKRAAIGTALVAARSCRRRVLLVIGGLVACSGLLDIRERQ
jgi:hypothetical protein